MHVRWTFQGAQSLGRMRVIAESTFLESARDRTLAVPLVLAGLLIGAALFTRTLSLGQQAKLLQDFGLAGLSFFSNVLVILAVTTTLGRELGRGTILPVLSKPLRRGELIVGKYGGVLGVVVINIAAILAGLYLGLVIIGASWSHGVLWAAALSLVEVMVVGAVAVFFSVVSSPILAMVLGGLTMLIGHTTADLRDLAAHIGGRLAHGMADVLYFALPNLEVFDVRAAVVHGYSVEPAYLGFAVLYGTLYAAAVLYAAVWIFARRDLV